MLATVRCPVQGDGWLAWGAAAGGDTVDAAGDVDDGAELGLTCVAGAAEALGRGE
jgi:hypothetical protein